MPKIYAIVSGCLVAVIGVLGQQGVIDPGLATAVGTLVSMVVAQLAHNAPSPKA